MKGMRNRSRLIAIPEGPEHIRGYTATGILMDEVCFHDDVEKTLAAADPALGKHGRLTLISSVGPGFFEQLAFDKFRIGGR